VRGDLDEDWAADERPAAAAARTAGDGDDDDDGGWGAGSSAAAAPAAPAAHAPVSAPFYPPPAAPLPPYGPGAAAAAATPATGGGQTNNNNNNNVVGAVAVGVGTVAGVVGGVAAAGAKALLGAVTNRGQAGQQQQLGGNNTNKPPTAAQPNPPYPPANTTNNNTALAQAAAALDQGAARRFSYDDLSRATNGFAPSNLIGRGGYGCVYRGVMDGVPVAVKTLDAEAMAAVAAGGGGWGGGGNNANDKNGGGARRQGAREFGAEVAILSRLHHPHVVLLLGACPEACMLVYELLDYSLEQLLRGGGGGGGGGTQQQPQGAFPSLPWPERVRIAAETAAALAFLHSANPAIVHLDVKPGNILLTAAPGLRAKLSDVGLSRLMLQQQQNGALAAASTVLDSRLVGSAHYTCPEYVRSGRFGPASDTYSLGIVLLQCLSGRDASSVVGAFEAAMEQARRSGGRDTSALVRCLDPRAGNWPPTEALAFADLAVRCAALSRAERPDLRAEVLPALLQLKQRAALYAQSGASGGGAAASGGGGNNNVNMRRMPSLQAGGAGGSVDAPPSVFVCPITTEVFEEPVLAADGYTYERMAIEGWLVKHNTSPITGLALEHRGLTPNLALKSAIAEWRTRVAGLAAAAR
jgi:serine/threonine protein kinase